jgi:hypothetical protein
MSAAPSSCLLSKAIAAAALPVPAAPIPDPDATVARLRTAADQYHFIPQRLAAWHEADRTTAKQPVPAAIAARPGQATDRRRRTAAGGPAVNRRPADRSAPNTINRPAQETPPPSVSHKEPQPNTINTMIDSRQGVSAVHLP